jgi:hypothetical protein
MQLRKPAAKSFVPVAAQRGLAPGCRAMLIALGQDDPAADPTGYEMRCRRSPSM